MSNAIKFSPDSSIINITTFSGTMNSTNVVGFSIEDQGIGIPGNELSDVFDKFVQSSKTKTGAGGTGLGLSISQEIITIHKGEIWAESEEGKGAKFTFVIPTNINVSTSIAQGAI